MIDVCGGLRKYAFLPKYLIVGSKGSTECNPACCERTHKLQAKKEDDL